MEALPRNGTKYPGTAGTGEDMPATGVYECDVRVTVLSGGVGRGAPVELAPKPRILVLASPAEQLFELAIPEPAVRAAIEAALR